MFRFLEFTEGGRGFEPDDWLSAAFYSIQMILTDQDRQMVKMME